MWPGRWLQLRRLVAAQRLTSMLQRAARRLALRRKLNAPQPQWLSDATVKLSLSTISEAAAACVNELDSSEELAMVRLGSLGRPATVTSAASTGVLVQLSGLSDGMRHCCRNDDVDLALSLLKDGASPSGSSWFLEQGMCMCTGMCTW